ncbi:MAG: hypothetical protein ACXW1W_01485 [Methylococcaceae bacterium]
MRTPIISIVFFMLAALAGAAGQYLYKAGAEATDSTIASYLLNFRLWAGVISYIAVMALFIAAFQERRFACCPVSYLRFDIYLGGYYWLVSV